MKVIRASDRTGIPRVIMKGSSRLGAGQRLGCIQCRQGQDIGIQEIHCQEENEVHRISIMSEYIFRKISVLVKVWDCYIKKS